MKRILLISFVSFIIAASIPSFGSVEVTLLKCTSLVPGAPGYEVTNIADDLANDNYFVKLVPANPTATKTTFKLSKKTSFKKYGETTILYDDWGKSGYALFYLNDEKAVVDINLFDPEASKLNTNGPKTEYTCTSNTNF